MCNANENKKSIWKFERRLLPLKFVYFWSYAAAAALIPFFVTYYFEWGLTATELSIIQAAVTFSSFAIRPVVGRVADTTKYYRVCLVVCLLWCAVFHIPHMFVPKMPNATGEDTQLSNNSVSESNDLNISNFSTGSVPDSVNLPNCSTNSNCYGLVDNRTFSISEDAVNDSSPSDWFIGSRWNIFLLLLGLRLFASFGSSPAMSLTDTFGLFSLVFFALTLYFYVGYALSRSDQRLWGRQRCWSTFGWAFSTLSIGYFLHIMGSHFYLFVMAGALYLISAVAVAFLSPLYQHKATEDPEPSEKRTQGNLWVLLRRPEVTVYLLFTIVNGVLLAMEYNFLFLFLKESGANELLIGLHQVADSVVELPMFFFSGHIIHKIGYVPCFCISFAAYVIRLTLYSFLADPLYLVLLIELTHGFSFTLFLAAGSGYADALTPPGFAATLQGVFHSFYFSLGIGIGELGGGYLYPLLGARYFFRSGAVLAAFCAFLYTLIWMVWLRRLDTEKEIESLTGKIESENMTSLVAGVQTDAAPVLADVKHIDAVLIDDVPLTVNVKMGLISAGDREEDHS